MREGGGAAGIGRAVGLEPAYAISSDPVVKTERGQSVFAPRSTPAPPMPSTNTTPASLNTLTMSDMVRGPGTLSPFSSLLIVLIPTRQCSAASLRLHPSRARAALICAAPIRSSSARFTCSLFESIPHSRAAGPRMQQQWWRIYHLDELCRSARTAHHVEPRQRQGIACLHVKVVERGRRGGAIG